MIKANHTFWADIILGIYLNRIFKRYFYQISILGSVPETSKGLPLLILPNHSTWWDGFFIYLLNKKVFKRPGYLMMLERQLIKYRIFSRVGAYSINQEKPKDVHAALSYTVSLLSQPTSPRPLVCIFPQGELLPWGIRPLGYQKGMEWIMHRYGHPLNILPLAIRSEFCSQQLPEVFLMFGENYQFSSASFPGIAWLEKIQTDLLNTLANCIVKKVNGTILLNGHRSINQTFDIIRRKD